MTNKTKHLGRSSQTKRSQGSIKAATLLKSGIPKEALQCATGAMTASADGG